LNPPAGIILAGGRSQRMGTNKALLPLPGQSSETFLVHIISTLAPLCAEMLIVARDQTQFAHVALPGTRLVFDEKPGGGPLMGLYSGLKAIHPSSTHALLVAVDMPFIQPTLISYLLAQPHNDALLIPLVDQVPQVLLAVYPRVTLPHIEARLREGRRDLRSLLTVCPVRYIEEAQLRTVDPHLRSFVNINTPEEFDLRSSE